MRAIDTRATLEYYYLLNQKIYIMPLDEIQRILKTIQIKKHILIVTRQNPSPDAIASSLGLRQLLKKIGKKADIVIYYNQYYSVCDSCAFLPGHKDIQNALLKNKNLLLEFDIKDADIRGLTYKLKNGKLSIRLFTDNANLQLGQPSVKQDQYPYDLIVALGCTDLESLGMLYDEHAEFFYHTPIVNIDHSPENEHFGELNLVEMTATATAEILFMFAEALGKNLLDEKISTCLLTGIIHESRSFQKGAITPRSLAIASELMSLGADRGLIIQNLFHNKEINTLQLWGRVLSGLSVDQNNEIAYSVISEKDFLETKTREKNLHIIADDFFQSAPKAKIAALLFFVDGYLNALVHTHEPSIDLRKSLARFSARGSASFVECHLYTKKEKQAIELIQSAALWE